MGALAYSNEQNAAILSRRPPEVALASVLHLASDTRCFAERLRAYVRIYADGLPDDIVKMLELHYGAYKPMASTIGISEFAFFERGVRTHLFKGSYIPLGKREAQVMFVGAMILMLPEGSDEWRVYARAWNEMRGVPRNYHIKL